MKHRTTRKREAGGGGGGHDLLIWLSFCEIHIKSTKKFLYSSASTELLMCLIRETRSQQICVFSNVIIYKLYIWWDTKTNKMYFSSYEKCTLLLLLSHCTAAHSSSVLQNCISSVVRHTVVRCPFFTPIYIHFNMKRERPLRWRVIGTVCVAL
jgi:hypothetical protein